jgi:hypothetical protein
MFQNLFERESLSRVEVEQILNQVTEKRREMSREVEVPAEDELK